MVQSARRTHFRVLSLFLGLALVCLAAAVATPARAAGDGAPFSSASDSGASVSIINGRGTRIRNWPWQVALAYGGPGTRRFSAKVRAFCGGSLIAPDLVVTAAHCVADLNRDQMRRIEVISGRTWLSNRIGGISYVKKRIMPLSRKGVRKFGIGGATSWDVALLKLKRRIPGRPIKLAGAREAASFAPGTLIKTTGWGVVNVRTNATSNVLRVVSQVVLPDAVCRRDNGRSYQPRTMVCLGGPAGNTSTCFGDSGGPMVARVSTGWRLVGLTSFGDPFCNPAVPSVDTRVSGRAIRGWIKRVSLRVSGVDPVGYTGVPRPRRPWCSVPDLNGRTVGQSRRALTNAGCRLGKVRRDRFRYGRSGRTNTSSLPQGWLAPIGQRVDIWINR